MIKQKIIRYLLMLILVTAGITFLTYDKLSNAEIINLVLLMMICFIFIDLYFPLLTCSPH